MSYTCPTCGTELRVSLDAVESDEEFVRQKILGFLAGHNPSKGSISPDGENIYQFHLQTYDSPEGDVWIQGRAEYSLRYGTPRFKVLEMKSGGY